jgi:hypothetical protein
MQVRLCTGRTLNINSILEHAQYLVVYITTLSAVVVCVHFVLVYRLLYFFFKKRMNNFVHLLRILPPVVLSYFLTHHYLRLLIQIYAFILITNDYSIRHLLEYCDQFSLNFLFPTHLEDGP